MEELAKALAQAVKTGSDLAWPALVMFFVTNALSYLSFAGAVVSSVWIITRGVLKYPELEARAAEQRVDAEVEREERRRKRYAETGSR